MRKKVKRRNWANGSRLPLESQKLLRSSLKGEKLVPLQGLHLGMGEALGDGAFGLREEVSRRWGLEENACRGEIGAEAAVDESDRLWGRFYCLCAVCLAKESKRDAFGETMRVAGKRISSKRSYTGREMGETGFEARRKRSSITSISLRGTNPVL